MFIYLSKLRVVTNFREGEIHVPHQTQRTNGARRASKISVLFASCALWKPPGDKIDLLNFDPGFPFQGFLADLLSREGKVLTPAKIDDYVSVMVSQNR